MELKTKMMQVNGLNLNVFDEGKGEPILLLHGFPDSIKLWRNVAPKLLDAGYRVIMFDQRGFGESDAPEGVENYTSGNMLRDIAAVLAQLGVTEKVKLVGHDWGSNIGWGVAIYMPHLISSYVCISVGHPLSYRNDGGFDQKKKGWYTMCFQWEELAEKMFMDNDWAAFRLFLDYHPELDTHWLPDLSRPGRFTAGLNWYRANMGDNPGAEPPPPVEVPVLGIWSDEDRYLSEEQMINTEKYMKAPFTYKKITGCKHWIALDKPDELVGLILDYYKTL